ncbi:hydrogenase expression/formation protein HypD [Thermoanaerobacter italicus Ab9]|uniref:Hydrogenase expression/formation protein HypD n=1 Tax=Thermoanaerobacter italicus (strain DSM 9252 / Ab9) TaxID=580331 RepID=D3T3Q6_THEIA|nr:hydrogenase formation protein HypD [Thermoanaerobacter italicus]ADD02858.1 hydrogenase expression/formation protein HypD [Thermoanaerobacter italicus Ab9]
MQQTEMIKKAKEIIDVFNPGVQFNIMEVCGSHTMAISKFGLRQILPKNIRLISGPGCPVCVTAQNEIDSIIELSNKNVVIATFGDLIRVPGSKSSLQQQRAAGKEIKVFYSPLDALKYAEENPTKEVVFLGIGFETTIPTVAVTIKEAKKKNIKNYSVYCLHKTMPEALRVLLEEGSKVQGFLLPGHVSAITGSKIYEFIPKEFGVGGVISGFEAMDILMSIIMLLKNYKNSSIEIQYKRVVREEGNVKAQKIIEEIFEPCDSTWRGLGKIKGSGLKMKDKYKDFDAAVKFDIKPIGEEFEIKGCRCGDVLKGSIYPNECPLFGNVCTPENPVGPCMVSSEGSCAAFYKYGA